MANYIRKFEKILTRSWSHTIKNAFKYLLLVMLFSILFIFDIKREIQYLSQYFLAFTCTQIGNNETPPSGYLLWSPNCRIPDLPVMDASIRRFSEYVEPKKCDSQIPVLTSVIRHNDKHTIIVDTNRMSEYFNGTPFSCCYSLITRRNFSQYISDPDASAVFDDHYRVGKCKQFSKNVSFVNEEDFVKIECCTSTAHYRSLHSFVKMKKALNDKINEGISNGKKLSVAIIGLDSISRLNFLRTMPKTADYLKEKRWLWFNVYNKINGNTFQNLMALLTGLTEIQARKLCIEHPVISRLDQCPFIWKNYSSNGYVTCYAEDEQHMSSFNNGRYYGFENVPTDFYIRPFFKAAEDFLEFIPEYYLKVCIGSRPHIDYVLEYALDFFVTYKKFATFSLFWANSYSHNFLNSPKLIDLKMMDFFQQLDKLEVFENTIVLFLSDHGMRFGAFRETYLGWMEEKSPFFYISVPKWFRKKYPKKIANLKKNTNRLISPFDVYHTLADILQLENVPTTALGCPKCMSLFKEIPWKRSCKDAGIPDECCLCSEYEELSQIDDCPIAERLSNFVMAEINRLLKKAMPKDGTKCAELKLKKVISIKTKIFTGKTAYKEYIIDLESYPGRARFEAIVRHRRFFEIVNTIDRISVYGNQSACVEDTFLKNFCFCQPI